MKRILILMINALAVMPYVAIGQTAKMDSLKVSLSEVEGVQRAELFLEMAREALDVDNELSYRYAAKASHLSLKFADTLLIIRATRVKSQVFRRLGKFDSVLYLSNKALATARRHNEVGEMNALLNNIGLVYLHLAAYDKALESFFEILSNVERYKDEFWKSVVLNNIGLVYQELYDYSKAYDYYHKALQIKNETGTFFDREVTLINMAQCMTAMRDFEHARALTDEAYRICGENCAPDRLESIYNNYAVIAFLQRDMVSAERYFISSYDLNKRLSNGSLALANLTYLVKLNLANSKYFAAKEYMNEINSLIDNGAPYNSQICQAYLAFISWYEKINDLASLSLYQKKYIELRDSVFSQELTRNLMKIEVEHRERENRARIESQNEILSLNGKIIQRQRYLNIFIGLVALLLITISILLLKRNRQKQTINKLLDRQVFQRTQDLQLNRDLLFKACHEREQFLLKTSIDLKSHLVTMEGLCNVGLKDIQDPKAGEYFYKMELTLKHVNEIVNHARSVGTEFLTFTKRKSQDVEHNV